MLFNSVNFILFLIITVAVYFLFPARVKWIWLLAASCYFYYMNGSSYLFLFLAVIVLNFSLAIVIQNAAGKKRNWLYVAAIVLNILLLCFYKYAGFISGSVADTAAGGHSVFSDIIMPLGISYLIFSLLSYLIEIKRGNITAEKHPGRFAAAYLFFPKIAQGPIERPSALLPQFVSPRNADTSDIIEGLKLMVWGLFKKLVIADRLAIYVNAVYGNYEHHNGITLIAATLFYSFQIYADFSGYTDIAIGTARIMGFRLSENFNRPYLSRSIKEFWTKWHMSFSFWLRDYLFLPSAIRLTQSFRREIYLFIPTERIVYMAAIIFTFAICGIWHGEGLNYLLWGLFFGVAQSLANLTEKTNKRVFKSLGISKKSATVSLLNIVITFLLVSFSWIFFRSDNTNMAFQIIKGMTDLSGTLFIEKPTDIILSVIGVLILAGIELWQEYRGHTSLPFKGRSWLMEQAFYAVIIIFIIMFGVLDGGQFIYFQY